MKNAAPDALCRADPTDPPADRTGQAVPARIAALLHILSVLLGFGRHLADTAQRRAARPGFSAIAACFGTGRMSKILAHLQRGLLRAKALERVLLARAARGRDIGTIAPRAWASAAPDAPPIGVHAGPQPPAEHAASPAGPPAEPQAAPKAAKRPSRPRGWNDPEIFMPTLEELEAQVRRRPLGRTLVEICLDLAVVPGLCTGAFWSQLFDSIGAFGGSVSVLMAEKRQREVAYSNEQDKIVGSDWSWQELTRDGMRRVLGFNIGEAIVDSFCLGAAPDGAVTAVATGPP